MLPRDPWQKVITYSGLKADSQKRGEPQRAQLPRSAKSEDRQT